MKIKSDYALLSLTESSDFDSSVVYFRWSFIATYDTGPDSYSCLGSEIRGVGILRISSSLSMDETIFSVACSTGFASKTSSGVFEFLTT